MMNETAARTGYCYVVSPNRDGNGGVEKDGEDYLCCSSGG